MADRSPLKKSIGVIWENDGVYHEGDGDSAVYDASAVSAGYEASGCGRHRLCIVAGPKDQKLRMQSYTAIRQRIDSNCVLPHLDRAETAEYIRMHLDYAGCEQEFFTDRAVDEVFRISCGILRMINRICEKSPTYAAQQQKRLMDDHIVRYVDEHEVVTV